MAIDAGAPAAEPPLTFDPDSIGAGAFPVRFGRYELNGLLGDGATARVFRAHLLGPANFRKPVALKIVRANARAGGDTRSLVFDEARIGGRLIHPNVVETYDVGERGGRLFVAMQLVDGLTARQLMRQVDRLTPRAACELIRQIADGLAHAHSLVVDGNPAHLVHRDLKPANVFVGRDGIARIADFGIARAVGLTDPSAEGSIWGTLGYMAPEQAFGRPAAQSADVFSAGIIMAELAMGKRFAAVRDVNAYLAALKELGSSLAGVEAAIDAAVPGLGPIAARCLRLVPDERYPSARPLARDLAELEIPKGRSLAATMHAVLGSDPADEVVASVRGSAEPESMTGDSSAALDDTLHTLSSHIEPPAARLDAPSLSGPLVGRGDTLDRLRRRLAGGARLVTLTGVGGVGKSRLVRELAASLQGVLTGGVHFCELAQARLLDDLLAAVARTFLLPLPDGETPEARTERLGRALAGRGPLLLVLDALEPLAGGAAATLGRWLTLAPEARFLATGRERLRLEPQEQVERLGPLAPTEGRALFLARAASLPPDRRDHPEVLAEIDDLVERLGGLPLAIELAAAHADRLTGDGGFADRFEAMLEPDASGEGPLHRGTLRATLASSWTLLAPWERATLAQLSVFQGGFTLEAVQAILDLTSPPRAPFPMFAVEALLERSLVYVASEAVSAGRSSRAEGGAEGAGDAAAEELPEPRFSLYPQVQAFAAERLAESPGEREAVEARHGNYFARFGAPGWICALDTHGGTLRRLALARDHQNLEAAAMRALRRLDSAAAAGSALALVEIAPLCGRHEAARQLAQQVLAADAPPRIRGWLALRLGELWREVARADLGERIAEEVLRMADAVEDESLAARALDLAAACAMEGARPDPARALDACVRGLARAANAGDRVATGILLGRQGGVETAAGNAEAACDVLGQALSLHREVGNVRGETRDLGHLGEALLALGSLPQAARSLKAGVLGARRNADTRAEAQNLRGLAELSILLQRLPDAHQLAERALALQRASGSTRLVALAEGLVAEIRVDEGDLEGARAMLHHAIEACDELEDGVGMGTLRAVLAAVTARAGDVSTARYLLRAAESFLREAGDRAALARMLCRRGEIECTSVNLVGAWTAYNEANALATELGAGPNSPVGRAVARLAAELTES